MTVITMDCRLGMSTLPADGVDAIVTDPPYGLGKQPNMREVLAHWLAGDDYEAPGGGFMGKKWDSFVPGPLTWGGAFRVLKPGGYCAVFASSRTADLMSTSLRLGGFEIVDTLHWLYGTGFPKSLDISKAIDKRDGLGAKRETQLRFTEWCRSTGLTATRIDEITSSRMGSHYTTAAQQPSVPVRRHLELLRPHFGAAVPAWVEAAVNERTTESENMKKRKVTGSIRSKALAYAPGEVNDRAVIDIHTTTAHSDEAKQWEGWGTALKPCHEPIILCRKPLEGTYADNIMTHAVGALNIEGCRVGGRWPGNVLHDGCLPSPMDRYFYSAKASRADRDHGLEDFEMHTAGETTGGRVEGSAGLESPRAGAGRTGGARNAHPTVKPTELMRWLCRLVTPPGGTVLDPFTGSGSTGRGATLEGLHFLGFEMSAEYAAIATARINALRKG